MLYLLDANVLITAHNTYYPIDSVPEFWEWLLYNGEHDHIKIPLEMMDEIKAGKKDPLLDWLRDHHTEQALLLNEEADPKLVQHVVCNGYADDLTDVELEQLGLDPLLIAYAMMKKVDRCVVTLEVSAPSKQRQNRRIPNVCDSLGVRCCEPFEVYRLLGFKTRWRTTEG